MLKNVKIEIKKYKKIICNFALTNKLFISFIVLMLFEAYILRLQTLGWSTWNSKAIFFELAVITLLGSLGYLFKPKNQFKYFQTVLCFSTAICTINAIYYTFYNSFVTIGLLETLGQVETVKDAFFDRLVPLHAIHLFFPIIYFIINKKLKKGNYFTYVSKIEKSKKNFGTIMLIGVIVLCSNIIMLTGTDISRLVKQWNREYIVDRYGVMIYQMNDIVQNTKSKLLSYFGYDEAAQRFLDYYTNKKTNNNKNKYTDIYKDKNVVFVHMESIMSMFVGMEINGQEVTPTLNKLTKEGLYFSNFYPQISVGTSSDTEFTLSSSLMPALSGTVFVSYFDRNYLTLQKLLKEQDYYTFSMHANNSSMWNRKAMHENMGYDKFYSKEYFEVTDENTIVLGLSDEEFFKQIIPYLNEIETSQDKYMGTLITLTNHTPWSDVDKYGEFDLTKTVQKYNEELKRYEEVIDPYLDNTKIGKYIKSVHYADKCLGQFIESLYTNDIMNDTVFVFYGDHDAKLSTKEYNYLFNYDPIEGKLKEKEDPGYIEYDYYANELNRKTPLIIWTKDHKIKGEVKYYMGMIDVLPTIGNMMGFKNPFALGNDIFNIKDENIIVFSDGNFLTSKLYYDTSKSEYKVLKESVIIDESYIENCKKHVDEVLEISNDIIVYNLIELEGHKILGEN